MKLRYVGIGYLILVYMATTLEAGSLIPSIDRIRKKVENVANAPSENFREVLAHAGITNNVVSGHCVLRGGPSDGTKELNIQDVEKALNDLYWSNQKQFVDELNKQMQQSEIQATLLLKQKIKEKYGTIKTPLIVFAQALATEEQQLKDLLNSLLRLSNTGILPTAEKTKRVKQLKVLYDRQLLLTQTLENLIRITNTLLM